MRSRFNGDSCGKPCYHDTAEEVKDLVQEASRLEGQIRDYLQLRTGELALEESKKSIEVSNQQLQEGKRGQYALIEK